MPAFLLTRNVVLPDGTRKVFPLGEGERSSFHFLSMPRKEWFDGVVKASPSLLVKMEEEERKRKRSWEEVQGLSDPFAEEAVRSLLLYQDTYLVRVAGFASKLMGLTDGFLHSLLYHVRCSSEGKKVVFAVDGDWLNEQSFTWAVHFLLSSLPDSGLLLVRRPTSPSHLNFLHSANPPFSGPPLYPNEEGKPMSWADGMRKGGYADRVFLCFGKAEEGKPSGYANLLVADLNVYLGGGEESKKEMAQYEAGIEQQTLFPKEGEEEWEGKSLVPDNPSQKVVLPDKDLSRKRVVGFLTRWFDAKKKGASTDDERKEMEEDEKTVLTILKKQRYAD